jgi:threonine dehydratase
VDVKQAVLNAETRIRPHIYETPLEFSPYLSRLSGCKVYLKLETVQCTGSFKYRGAVNRILSLTPQEKDKGLITSSSGNHGAAFVYASRKMGCKGTLYLPENVSRAKLELIKWYGAEDIEFHGTDVADTESYARQVAKESGALFISPYNDPFIIGGQGTIAVELMRRLDHIDAVFVPIGGGGLMSGIAGYLKAVAPNIQMIGCQPENSPVMTESVKAGKLIEMESKPTLSGGTAGGIEKGAITFDICRVCVDDFVLVSEAQIEEGILLALEKSYLLIEGAAALSIACFLKTAQRFKNKTVVLVISGKRLHIETLKQILSKGV